MSAPAPPPGWYSDPEGSGQRWWDGTQWSEHRQAPPQPTSGSGVRWKVLLGVLAAGILLLGGCAALIATSEPLPGDESAPTADDGGSDEGLFGGGGGAGEGKLVDNRNLDDVFDASAGGFEGATVEIAGQAYDREGDLLLVYGDAENATKPIQVTGSTEGVSSDDYVLVKGTLTGAGSYETVLGANEETLDVEASSVESISEKQASRLANPTTREVTYDVEQTKSDFTVRIKSLAWTEKTTKMAIEAENDSSDAVTLDATSASIKQGSRQYDQDFENADDTTSAFDSAIRPGVTKKGTLTFERVKRSRGKVEIDFDWYSDDIDILDPKPFQFTLELRK